ncbi:endonuclease/exonuclease/phosphatase family protein [Maridesulfovibrio sp. FT414]|uniref:endonuclease/exonuclease/phosphatase family protein n=1 Tax=Maridesulfovibrio sp. FT414 TaxID=2979469 RepID=UPI003D805FE0
MSESGGSFKVMSYNMGFASGPIQHTMADDHPESFFETNLDNIVALITEQKADIVLLQEVDIDAKRSWYTNQLDYMMKRLGWGYAAPVVDWKLYFPLRKERKITKATVVISRFPILFNEYCLTSAKPNFESMPLNIFYYPLLWKSCMQKVSIDVNGKPLDVYNVHLCVWNRAARVAQAAFLADWINSSSGERPFVIGGDFNFQAYIRGTPVPDADMARPPFMNILWERLAGLGEIMSSDQDSVSDIHMRATFPERSHRYDFIFYSGGLASEGGAVVGGIDASDHLPVIGTFRFKE